MVTKLVVLRPRSLPLLFLSPPNRITTSLNHNKSPLSHSIPLSTKQNPLPSYGPSLCKGHTYSKPSSLSPPLQQQKKNENNDDDVIIDRDSFARVFHVSALRIPSDRCFSLESRLRGHLLNWPRVRNIARVPGDDIEPQSKPLLPSYSDSDSDSVYQRRIYGKAEGDGDELSPVLYRDLLARKFNSRGFVKFRNLAKMSRPNRRGERAVRRQREREESKKEEVAVEVEVVEKENSVVGKLRGLLGDGFKGGEVRWKGSTRLLLLDESCAGKAVHDLPEAIQVDYHMQCLMKKGKRIEH